ncbi:hypothetical protein L210DRAFT_3506655 [Boletus edulis BED1]|uniref:Uncharacterized protein n=1 Tax=Boletus edulis BED1 TaxID=1328754 RepID=A0AAD4BMD4_BOLED|nr:hypothetical protein L210DRAFT_3506655 [Boletus edulis BED1]
MLFDWLKLLERGTVQLCDRITTSNSIGIATSLRSMHKSRDRLGTVILGGVRVPNQNTIVRWRRLCRAAAEAEGIDALVYLQFGVLAASSILGDPPSTFTVCGSDSGIDMCTLVLWVGLSRGMWSIVSVVPNVLVCGSIVLQVATKGVKYDSIDGILLTGCFMHDVSFCVFDFVTSKLKTTQPLFPKWSPLGVFETRGTVAQDLCILGDTNPLQRDRGTRKRQLRRSRDHCRWQARWTSTMLNGQVNTAMPLGVVAELGKDPDRVSKQAKHSRWRSPRIMRLQFLTAYAGVGKVVGALSISGGRNVGLINPAVEMVSGSGMMIV